MRVQHFTQLTTEVNLVKVSLSSFSNFSLVVSSTKLKTAVKADFLNQAICQYVDSGNW
jgi:hypothetical protein